MPETQLSGQSHTTLGIMKIIVEGPTAEPERLRATGQGAVALGTDDLFVIYTVNFTQAVQRLTGEHTYTDTRGAGNGAVTSRNEG